MSETTRLTRKIPWLTAIARKGDQEALLDAVFDAIPYTLLMVDSQSWQILHANTAFLEYSLYPHSDLIGMDVRQLFANPENRAGETSDESLPLDFPASLIAEHLLIQRLRSRDQSQPLVQIQLVPVKGNLKHVILVIEPLTATLKSQDKIWGAAFWTNLIRMCSTAGDQNLETALEGALAAAADISGSEEIGLYRLSEGNPEIYKYASYGATASLPDCISMQDLLSLSRPRLWEPGKRPTCNLHRAARAAGFRYLATAPVGMKTALVGLIAAGSAVKIPSEVAVEIVQFLAAIVDVILETHLQRAALQSELESELLLVGRLKTIADRVQEGIIRVAPDLTIRGINPPIEQFLGFMAREVIGQSVEQILIGNELLASHLTQAQQGEAIFHLGDVRLYRRDGIPIQALIRIFPIQRNGQVDEILIFLQDLSKQEEVRHQTQRLENHALLGEMMAVFAHDVRNPINNISIGLQAMSMNLPQENPLQPSINRMIQDCNRLEGLVKSVLAFSKPMEYDMESLDVGLLLQRLLDHMIPRITAQKVLCNLQITPNCPQVLGNLRALERVFMNLIDNATQAMSEKGGTLSIKIHPLHLDEGGDFIEVCIADTGPGIPKEIQEHIFESFFTTNHKRNGTGLGLSITKRIVTNHKGNILFSSFPGGTVFRVQLPVIETEKSEQ